MNCRYCGSALALPLVDLGSAPPSNSYLTEADLDEPEMWLPLRVMVCENCWLVQTDVVKSSIQPFDEEYAYFSSFSTSWLRHAETFVAHAVARFGLNSRSLVVEVAANDGYLLQYVLARGIPCVGIEPTASTADAAAEKGIPIIKDFFGVRLAEQLRRKGMLADLIIANNVLAHVPDIADFVSGFRLLLAPRGIATFEFPHVLRLVQGNQFDTIYYEHYSYLSLMTVARILAASGLSVFDVQEQPTHGGSLRVFAQHADTGAHARSASVDALVELEARAGIDTREFYCGFQTRVDRIKNELLSFLIDANSRAETVAAYGAAAKGSTLLNYAGVRRDLVAFVVDRNPAKQSRYMPGSRIPIVDERRLIQAKPKFVLVLPWNIGDEVKQQLAYVRQWGGQFVTAIPSLEIAA